MKTLSVRQPWAWLIVNGYKDIENRDWKYMPNYCGPLLIHAAKGCTRDEYECAVDIAEKILPSGVTVPPLKVLDRGGIVGKVFMEGAVTRSMSPWFFGRIGLAFSKAEKLPFFECKGQLGFFNVDYPATIPPITAEAADNLASTLQDQIGQKVHLSVSSEEPER